jgi:SAM-dependent methyltransferase/regulator of replication initiation timing
VPAIGRLATDLLSLSFDIYQRYRLVADAFRVLAPPGVRLHVLDAGGAGSPLPDLLPDHAVSVLDTAFLPTAGGFVVGDVTALPFRDHALDYAISVDVYEHIRPDQRLDCLRELTRVSRRGVIVAAPFASAGVEHAERTANEFHKILYGCVHPWLREHIENGLPRLEEVTGFLQRAGLHPVALPNGYLPRWTLLILSQILSLRGKSERELYENLCRLYNQCFYAYDNREPCYRYAVVASDRPPSLDRLQPPPAEARGHDADAVLAHVAAIALPLITDNSDLRRHVEALTQDGHRLAFERDALRRAFDAVTLDRDALAAEASQLKWQLSQLKWQLTEIENSSGWRLLTRWRRLRLALIPINSARERAYLAGVRTLEHLLRATRRDDSP